MLTKMTAQESASSVHQNESIKSEINYLDRVVTDDRKCDSKKSKHAEG